MNLTKNKLNNKNIVSIGDSSTDLKQKHGEAFSLEKSLKRETHKSLVCV